MSNNQDRKQKDCKSEITNVRQYISTDSTDIEQQKLAFVNNIVT